MKLLKDMDEVEIRELMTACGNQLKAVFAVLEVESPKFLLVVFNDPEIAQYISNCERSSMIAAMRETAERLEKKQDVTR